MDKYEMQIVRRYLTYAFLLGVAVGCIVGGLFADAMLHGAP